MDISLAGNVNLVYRRAKEKRHILLILTIALASVLLLVEWLPAKFEKAQDLAAAEYTLLKTQQKNLLVEDIHSAAASPHTQKMNKGLFNLGDSTTGWIRIDLQPEYADKLTDVLIRIQRNNIYSPVYLHYQNASGWQQLTLAGANASLTDLQAAIPKDIASKSLYVQLSGRYLRGHVSVLSQEQYLKSLTTDAMQAGFYFGALTLCIILNLLLYLYSKNTLSLIYSCLLTVVFVWFFVGQGWMRQFLGDAGDIPLLKATSLGMMFSIMLAEFTKRLLKLGILKPALFYLITALQTLTLFVLIVHLLFSQHAPSHIYQLGYKVGLLTLLLMILGIIAGAIINVRRKRPEGAYFLFATSVFIGVAVLMALSAGDIIQIEFSWKLMQLASLLEIGIFSGALIASYFRKLKDSEQIEKELDGLKSKLAGSKIDRQSFKDTLINNLVEPKLMAELAKILTIINELIYIKADGNYSEACHFYKGKVQCIFIDYNLHTLLSNLGEKQLLRCHRSFLINPSKHYQFVRRTTADFDLVHENIRIPVGRKFLAKIRRTIQVGQDES